MEGYVLDKRLRQLRGKKSLQDVADDIGINRVTLTNYENGMRHPNAETLYKIVQYYKVSINWLIGLPDFSEQEWERAYQKGREDMKNEILQMISCSPVLQPDAE